MRMIFRNLFAIMIENQIKKYYIYKDRIRGPGEISAKKTFTVYVVNYGCFFFLILSYRSFLCLLLLMTSNTQELRLG